MTDDRPTDGHWLTYAEAAKCLGLTTEAVRALARRQKWDRRSPNAIGGQAWVLVPANRLSNKRPMVTANGQTFYLANPDRRRPTVMTRTTNRHCWSLMTVG
jgi:hypothetical protein